MYITVVYDKHYVESCLRRAAMTIEIHNLDSFSDDVIERSNQATILIYSMLAQYLMDFDQINNTPTRRPVDFLERAFVTQYALKDEDLGLFELIAPTITPVFEELRLHFYRALQSARLMAYERLEEIDDITFTTHHNQGVMIISAAMDEDVHAMEVPHSRPTTWAGLMPHL